MPIELRKPDPQTIVHKRMRGHGKALRGENLPRRSPMFDGRFGRMFRTLPPADHTKQMLHDLAEAIASPPEDAVTPETKPDGEENPKIPAGYTYLGQFIDHDLTFDPNSSLEKKNDPEALEDFRTPRFDLDNVYGRGPNDQPYLYDDDGLHFLLGRKLTGSNFDANTFDLPRNNPNPKQPKRALIGDPRNDENVIVSQLQGMFLRFHNSVVDFVQASGKNVTFDDIQQIVRWHYQWIVLHDFLPRIVGIEVLKDILPDYKQNSPFAGPVKANLLFYNWKKFPFIPIEFTAAAYRYGHSMVRPIYRLNQTLPDRQNIFDPKIDNSLVGFREFPSIWAIDWTLFFPIDSSRPKSGKSRIQPSYRIDTSIVNPLKNLPKSIASTFPNLAERNLLRGFEMSLPSGQSVARQMGIPVLDDKQMIIGKATGDPTDKQTPLLKINPAFADNAPLWYYILAESQVKKDDTHPRGVGARIIAEVFIGLLLADSHSFLSQSSKWQPTDFAPKGGVFDMAAFLQHVVKSPVHT
jgi:hypothetical protein